MKTQLQSTLDGIEVIELEIEEIEIYGVNEDSVKPEPGQYHYLPSHQIAA